MDIDLRTREEIWASGRIAIHFPDDVGGRGIQDCESLESSDYSGSAKKAMKCMRQIAEFGGYVFAEYWWQNEAIIGFVPPDSQIQILSGKWGSVHGYSDRIAILKTLSLQRTKYIRPSDFAVTFVARPRQGTIMRWPRAGDVIKNAVEGISSEESLADLSPDQQETLCSEFLRSPQAVDFGLPQLAHLTLPVGRTMRDIDIIGLASDGKSLFAQVTFAREEDVKNKKKSLLRYASESNCYLLLFCNTEQIHREGNLLVVPISEIATRFRASSLGQAWFLASRQLTSGKLE